MKTVPSPVSLRVNLLKTPFGVRRSRLTLSWIPPVDQTAYRVVLARGRANAEMEIYSYDSGWVTSPDSASVRPAGLSAAIESEVLYYVRVAIRDAQGQESAFSAPLGFTVAPEPAPARGIWAPEGDFALLRREFAVTDNEHTAFDRVLVTAAAVNPEPSRQYAYNLYVNGTEVGVGAFRLGKTPDGHDVIYAQTYDITSLLRSGSNCLAASCYALSDHGFFCKAVAYGADGEPHVLFSTEMAEESEWLALNADGIYGKNNSIGTHYFVAHACNVDARIFPFGFAQAGLDTSRDHGGAFWTAPVSVGHLMGGLSLIPSDTEPVSRYATPAATVQTLPDGSLLVDLGREIIGGLRWTVTSPSACAVTLTYSEQLTPEGLPKCPMNTGNRYVETWTLKEGEQTLETLSMMAFRYVQIHGYPVPVSPDSVWGVELRKPFDLSASSLTSDNPLLTDLYSLVKHTVKVTSQDIYVDSQSRERGAYEGDLLINMLAAYAVEDSYAPARLTVEYLLGHRTWPADYLLMIIFAARADYMATGDDSLLREWYDTLKANLFTEYLDETGLIRSPVIGMSTTNAVLVDWPASERDGYEMSCPYNTVFNALSVRAYADMAAIAAVLGKDADAIEFSIRADRLRRTMIGWLYDPVDGLFMDGLRENGIPSDHASQHATAFCLDCGVYDGQDMADHMAQAIEADGKICMSVYGAFFLLEGLYRTGHGAIANRLMLNTDASEGARTWAYMLYGLGATVTTEAWNQINKPNMTLSHPWGAAPAHMIASGILGVTPTSPAYETFDLRVSPEGLREVAGIIPTIRGGIGVSFRTDGETFCLTVNVPANATATVYLPDGRVKTVGAGILSFLA